MFRFSPRDKQRPQDVDPTGSPPGRQVVANGVTYFWRKVHLSSKVLPAVAHANGVGPKSYFMRLGFCGIEGEKMMSFLKGQLEELCEWSLETGLRVKVVKICWYFFSLFSPNRSIEMILNCELCDWRASQVGFVAPTMVAEAGPRRVVCR